MNAKTIMIPFERVAGLANLPPGTQVRSVYIAYEYVAVCLLVEHPDFDPIAEGSVVRRELLPEPQEDAGQEQMFEWLRKAGRAQSKRLNEKLIAIFREHCCIACGDPLRKGELCHCENDE